MNENLTTAVLQALAVQHTFAYAYLKADLTIVDCSENFIDFLELPSRQFGEQPITSILDELIGAEAQLTAVLHGEMSDYQLSQINRVQEDGSTRYMSLQITAVDPPQTGLLLLLVEDTTEIGRLQQQLEQAQNRLLLLRKKVDKI